jgi:hypothetical protein
MPIDGYRFAVSFTLAEKQRHSREPQRSRLCPFEIQNAVSIFQLVGMAMLQ